MEFIDIFLGIILTIGIIRGLWNGFFAELGSLISLLIGIWAALKFSVFTASFLQNHVSWNPQKMQIIAFIITFIAVVVGITLISKILTKTAGLVGLGLVNKIMGAVIGLFKSILILSVMLNLFSKINIDGAIVSKQTTDNSILYNPVTKVAAKIYPTIEIWYTEWQLQLKDRDESTSIREEI